MKGLIEMKKRLVEAVEEDTEWNSVLGREAKVSTRNTDVGQNGTISAGHRGSEEGLRDYHLNYLRACHLKHVNGKEITCQCPHQIRLKHFIHSPPKYFISVQR